MSQYPTEPFNTQLWGMEIRFQADMTKQFCFLYRSASCDKGSSGQMEPERWLLILAIESVVRISTHMNISWTYFGNKRCKNQQNLFVDSSSFGTVSALSGWSVEQEVLSLEHQWDMKCSLWMNGQWNRKMCPSSLSGAELSRWLCLVFPRHLPCSSVTFVSHCYSVPNLLALF